MNYLDQKTEVWETVPEFGRAYAASSFGNVARKVGIHCREKRILKPGRAGGSLEYRTVTLSFGGKKRTLLLHRLIAKVFIGPPPGPNYQINHKDGDKSNNRVSNLEWVTPLQNMQHAVRTGLKCHQGENSSNAKLTDHVVRKIRALYVPLKFGPVQIARALGINKHIVENVVYGRSWTHVTDESTKAQALAVATKLWPAMDWRNPNKPKSTKPHDGMTDSALLAEWGRRKNL